MVFSFFDGVVILMGSSVTWNEISRMCKISKSRRADSSTATQDEGAKERV